jgi:hypothetical protein
MGPALIASVNEVDTSLKITSSSEENLCFAFIFSENPELSKIEKEQDTNSTQN